MPVTHRKRDANQLRVVKTNDLPLAKARKALSHLPIDIQPQGNQRLTFISSIPDQSEFRVGGGFWENGGWETPGNCPPHRQQSHWQNLSDGTIWECWSLMKPCKFQGKSWKVIMVNSGHFQFLTWQQPLAFTSIPLAGSCACVLGPACMQPCGSHGGHRIPSFKYWRPVFRSWGCRQRGSHCCRPPRPLAEAIFRALKKLVTFFPPSVYDIYFITGSL